MYYTHPHTLYRSSTNAAVAKYGGSRMSTRAAGRAYASRKLLESNLEEDLPPPPPFDMDECVLPPTTYNVLALPPALAEPVHALCLPSPAHSYDSGADDAPVAAAGGAQHQHHHHHQRTVSQSDRALYIADPDSSNVFATGSGYPSGSASTRHVSMGRRGYQRGARNGAAGAGSLASLTDSHGSLSPQQPPGGRRRSTQRQPESLNTAAGGRDGMPRRAQVRRAVGWPLLCASRAHVLVLRACWCGVLARSLRVLLLAVASCSQTTTMCAHRCPRCRHA